MKDSTSQALAAWISLIPYVGVAWLASHFFDIRPLGPLEARNLVRSLYRQEVERYPHLSLDPELAISHCDDLRVHSPQVVARLVHELVARLAMERRP